jgi:ubiquitin-protein ligase
VLTQRPLLLLLFLQLSGLRDALPCHWGSAVAVRVDARCASLLRACVLGAEGSPYAHGAFLFDILLPVSFPDAPPRVTFLTTGGGAWRANPNLYHNGMVCLSLLGTWEGPGWQARTSTLLQLLVSLQALVLNDEPYFNEPGCAACMSEAAVREQKRVVC